jgi:RNA polymerase sigma-70 factor (ECF subfamily)
MHSQLSSYSSVLSAEPAAAPASRDNSDDTLVASVAAGNRPAMQLLFVRYYARVYRFLLRMVGSAPVAEDLSSEVFLAVWQQASRFRSRSSVLTWLLGIARNKALSEMRARQDERPAGGEEIEAADPAHDPEAAYSAKRRRELLRRCLSRLSHEHREIIDLVYYHDKSVREVAQILGIPSNTVKTRMFYARNKLSKLITARGLMRAGL